MKRLHFRLPRKPPTPRPTTRSAAPTISFQELASLVDPTPDTSTLWRKAVDRDTCAVLFFQLDLSGDLPKFAKCVYIRLEEFRVGKHADLRLVPSVFLDEEGLPAGGGLELGMEPKIASALDVVKLLQYVELFPDVPDEEEGRGKDARGGCDSEGIVVDDGREGLMQVDGDFGCVDDGDYTPSPGSDKSSPPAPKVSKGSRPNIALSATQAASIDVVKYYLQQPGVDKEELYPGAGIYVPSFIIQAIRTKYFEKLATKRRHALRARTKGTGACVALDILDSLGTCSDQLPFQQTPVLEVFDKEFLQKIAKFVNLNHPCVLQGERPALSTDQLLCGIRNRIKYLHHKEDLNKVHRANRKKKCDDEAAQPPLKRSAPSLIRPPEGDAWNEELLYNHPDFRPSYLFARPDYVPLCPVGDSPPVHIKEEWLEYFCSEQSHVDYPRDQNWIRALLFKIIDQGGLLHMCHLHRQQEQEGRLVSIYTLFSTGFFKILDEFIGSSGRLSYDMESLRRTVHDWFKDYRRTIMQKGLLDKDPASLQLKQWRTARRKGFGKSTMQ